MNRARKKWHEPKDKISVTQAKNIDLHNITVAATLVILENHPDYSIKKIIEELKTQDKRATYWSVRTAYFKFRKALKNNSQKDEQNTGELWTSKE